MLFSQRQSTQFEEMESLNMNRIPQASSRSRNLSSDRQQINDRSIQLSIENSRQRHKAQSYSVEKSLNLSSQNQKVENLVASWMQQKNLSSLNSSSNNVQPTSQFESQGRQSNRPHIIIEEDLLFTEDGDKQHGIQSNKVNKNQNKTPSTTRPHAKSIKEQCILLSYEESFDVKKSALERNFPKKNINSYAQRPQTTKMHTSNQVKSSPVVYKEQTINNPMKSSQIEQSKNSNLYSGSNSYCNNINNRNKQNSYQKIVRKPNPNTEFQLDNQCIPDLIRLKDLILSTYLKQNRALISSQNQIVKNFDEIVAILKQDFPQHQ